MYFLETKIEKGQISLTQVEIPEKKETKYDKFLDPDWVNDPRALSSDDRFIYECNNQPRIL